MSKTIQAMIIANPHKFVKQWSEDHNDRGLDYWVELREPYFVPATETGQIHENTVRETLATMRTVIKGKHNGYAWESI